MRAVIQRAKEASVSINGELYSSIKIGLVCLLGIKESDDYTDIDYIVDKLVNLRIFRDENDKMNLNIVDVEGELLIVSQFTLYGDARKGRRPSYDKAANGDIARPIYEKFLECLKDKLDELKVKTGVFSEKMEVELINDGPVTILLDSKNKKQ